MYKCVFCSTQSTMQSNQLPTISSASASTAAWCITSSTQVGPSRHQTTGTNTSRLFFELALATCNLTGYESTQCSSLAQSRTCTVWGSAVGSRNVQGLVLSMANESRDANHPQRTRATRPHTQGVNPRMCQLRHRATDKRGTRSQRPALQPRVTQVRHEIGYRLIRYELLLVQTQVQTEQHC